MRDAGVMLEKLDLSICSEPSLKGSFIPLGPGKMLTFDKRANRAEPLRTTLIPSSEIAGICSSLRCGDALDPVNRERPTH